MKQNIIMLALSACLVSAPVAGSATAADAESASMDMGAAKKQQKKTTKKTTKKSTKKSTKNTKTTKTTGTTKTAKTTTTTGTTGTTTATPKTAAAAAQQPVESPAETGQVAKSAAAQQGSTGSSVLGSIIGGILGGSSATTSSSNSGSSIVSALTSIFDLSKIAKKNDLVGTWTYTEPAVVFSSDNALKNIGGKVASQAIEKQLQGQFEKFGIKKGAMQMTFDKDGNFTQTVGGKTLSGTYTVSGQNVTLKYAGQVQQIVGTTQIDGSDLLIVMDASKLLKYAKVVGSLTGNSLLSTAGNLLSSMNGMEVGLKLNK